MTTSRELAAIRFDHHETFVDFVRQYGRAERQGSYALWTCRWAERGEDPPAGEPPEVYVLTRTDKGWPDNPAFFHQSVEVDPEGHHLFMLPGRRHRKPRLYRVEHIRRADRLPALVGPVAEPEQPAPATVIFWCEDQDQFQHLVTTSFQLGCDRLQATAVNLEDEGGRRRIYLLRAERPSYFIVDAAISHARMKAFVPQAGGHLMVPVGTTHPLEALWDDAPEGVIFMDGLEASARISEMPPPDWTDIYGLTSFKLEGLVADESWTDATGALERFEIGLSLIPAHKPREVQIWMLRADERDRLEQLLILIPEDDLHVLQFTAQASPSGTTRLFIRERHTGVGREYIDFEGVPFAPYAGYPNLLLPVDQTLEPPLRKDRYREIFDLQPRHMVFVWQGEAGMQLVRLAESSFRPLPELVDYIVSASAEDLTAMVTRTVFDFQQYEAAPRRPRAVAPASERAARPEEVPAERPEGEGDAEAAGPTDTRAPLEVQELVVPDRQEQEEVTQSELEIKEAELEQEIIAEGQSVERWRRLAAIKAALDKPEEQFLSLGEALWLTFEAEDDPQAVHRELVAALERVEALGIEGASAKARQRKARQMAAAHDAHVGWLWLHFFYELGAITADVDSSKKSGELREFLSGAYGLLGQSDRRLRFKDRWLLWRQLIALNKDGMQEAKVRETLLLELTRHGLQPFETPGFIQNRIYQSRFIDDGGGEDNTEFLVANAILDAIAGRIENANDEVVRRVGAAILAYGYQRLESRARSDQYFAQAEGFYESATGLSHIEQAWIALYLGATRELQQRGGNQSWTKRYTQKLRQHASADLAHSELEVLEKSIFQRAESESPSEFFTPDNFRSLFPTSGKYTEAQQIKRELDEMVNAGKFNQALVELRDLANRAVAGNLKLDARQFAWLLGPITDALRRIGQAVEGIEVLSQFEQSVDRIKTRNLLGLYNTLLRLKLAEGYLGLGEEQRGTELIQLVLHNAYRHKNLQWLDHLDMLGAGLESIEVVPLAQRAGAVEEVLNALYLIEDHPQDSVNYRPIKLRLIDHCVEVALSKEKLSLKRFKIYLDEDEFHVRYRIVNDRITDPDPVSGQASGLGSS